MRKGTIMADEKTAEEPKKKSKLMLIIIIAVVVLLGGGGAGAYFMLSGSSKKEEAKPAPEPGKVISMDAITINLADGHFLKLGLAIQATAEAAEAPDGSHALDIAIEMFSNKSVAELSAEKGRDKLKKELTEKVEKAYEEEVMAVYFTEFVMQ
jgi:flagellar FliL protein